MYQALYLAFVAEQDYPIDDVILDGDLIAAVGATMATQSADDVEFLPVAEAAARVAVAPATIRVWMAQGRLHRYHAGRELRVRITELAELMGTPANSNGGNPSEATPEKEAELYLDRRRQAGRKRS